MFACDWLLLVTRRRWTMSRAIDALKTYLSQGGDLDVPDTGQPFVTITRVDGVDAH